MWPRSFLDYVLSRVWRLRRRYPWFLRSRDRVSDKTVTTHRIRPLSAEDLSPPELSVSYEDFGIVIQGPVVSVSQVEDSVAIYRKLFPGVHIVVSTWAGVAASKLLDKSLDVIVQDCSLAPGPGNINLQVATTRAGLEVLSSKKLKWAVKIRSDCRFYNPFALVGCSAILCNPANEAKIITSSLDTFINRPYSLSDFFHFGSVSTLKEYWQFPELAQDDTRPPEVILTSEFLKRRYTQMTLPTWADSLAQDFVVVDQSDINLLWTKYSDREFYFDTYKYTGETLWPLTPLAWEAIRNGTLKLSD